MQTKQIQSIEHMSDFASEIADEVVSRGPRKDQATVMTLKGELGAGKTTFTQAFARAMGVKDVVASPTFNIMKRYGVSRETDFEYLFHVDTYRMKDARDLEALGLVEIMQDPKNIVIIEWPEKIQALLPQNVLKFKFEHIDKDSREVSRL